MPDFGIDPDLIEMNGRYAVVESAGKQGLFGLRKVRRTLAARCRCSQQFMISVRFTQNGRKLLSEESGKERKIGLGKWWIDHDCRRQFDEIVYAPSVITKPASRKLNLWNGFGCEPHKGNCARYIAHLRDNICSGEEAPGEYLLNWMAYVVQFPERQGEVAVVLRGKEGTGKGVVAKHFGKKRRQIPIPVFNAAC